MGLTESQQKQKEKQIKWWKEREEEQLKHYITQEAEYQRRIEEIYDYMMDQIRKEINGFYTKYASKESITMAEAKKRVSELDIKEYERKAERYVKNKTFTAEANEEMRLYNATMKINRLEMLKANIGLELVDGFDDLQKYFDQILTDRTLEEFERQAGILGATIQENAKAAHAIVNASFHNATFSDRIWMYQDMLKTELDTLLRQGLIQGRNPKVLARHLIKLFGVSKDNAERLMVTELARVQTDSQFRSMTTNGYTQYEYIACGMSDVCDECKALDGKVFNIADAEIGKNAPPLHPRCHCSVAAYMDREEFDKWLEEQSNSLKTIEKSNENDIIKMYRKGNTYRKISEEGSQIIDMATYHKITNPAIKKGADIRIAKDDVLKRLNDQEATAVTYGDIIFFRPDVTVSDVLEEVYHFEQNRKGLNNQYDSKQRMIMNEIDAKQYLLSVIDKYQIPAEETELTRKQLNSYKKQMADMKERGEWRD